MAKRTRRPEPSEKQWRILNLRATGSSLSQIGAAVGCSKQYAHFVVKRWAHLATL